MECDKAIELLPWLLNGTLDPGERQAVERHLRTCAACRAALADTRAAWELYDWHPAPAELIALAAGGANEANEANEANGAARAETVRQHAAACPRCAAELELVGASRLLVESAPAAGAAEPLAFLAPAATRRKSPPPASSAPEAAGETTAAGRTWPRNALIAAGLAGLVALTGWFQSSRQVGALQDRLASLESAHATAAPPAAAAAPANAAPQAIAASPFPSPSPSNTAPGGALSASAAADLRRRADDAQTQLARLQAENRQLADKVVTLAASADRVAQRAAHLGAGAAAGRQAVEKATWDDELTPNEQATRGSSASPPSIPLSNGAASLALRTRQRGRYTDFEVDIRDAQGQLAGGPYPVARADRDEAFDEIDIILNRATLAPGSYTLELFGRDAQQPGRPREPVATYSIRIS